MEQKNIIYHILTLKDLKSQTEGEFYQPGNLAQNGFIHCTAEKATSLLVLEDYFKEISKTDMIIILAIETDKLKSEVKFEPPAPIQGAGISHIKEGLLFPHIYGSLNIEAVIGVGKVEKAEGKFIWPSTFDDLKKYL